jgi:hypothetical protein
LIEEHAEMSGPVDQAGQIDPIYAAVCPGDVKRPWRADGADSLDAGQRIHCILVT